MWLKWKPGKEDKIIFFSHCSQLVSSEQLNLRESFLCQRKDSDCETWGIMNLCSNGTLNLAWLQQLFHDVRTWVPFWTVDFSRAKMTSKSSSHFSLQTGFIADVPLFSLGSLIPLPSALLYNTNCTTWCSCRYCSRPCNIYLPIWILLTSTCFSNSFHLLETFGLC